MGRISLAVVALCVGVTACSDEAPITGVQPVEPSAASVQGQPGQNVRTNPTPDAVIRMIEGANARLAALGSSVRIQEAWLFTVGVGTDPYRRLRTGARWAWNPIYYYLDEADFTTQLPVADVDAALVHSYQRWNAVKASGIRAERTTDPAPGNHDILDGPPSTGCVDYTADVWSPDYTGFFPVADVVVGGWLSGDWFDACVGPDVIGVTFSFSYGDANRDHYTDRLYVEQYFNSDYEWVTSGATFLGNQMDLESIATHEDGHTFGLGHYGGAGKVPPGLFSSGNFKMFFSPEAIMNPGYLGGVKRNLYSIDEAALRTLY